MAEVKIDKRTRAYKESVKESGEVVCSPTGADIPTAIEPIQENQLGCHKCGKPDPDLVVISPQVSICRPCLKLLATNNVEKKALVESKKDYSKSADNPGFTLCTHCGGDLLPNEDGSKKHRVQGELCNACVWRNNAVKNPQGS